MLTLFRIFGFYLLFFLLTTQSAPGALTLRIHRCDVDRFPSITVLLNLEKDGAAVASPLLENFEAALEDGRRVKLKRLRSLEESGESLAMLLAVDTSGSMKEDQLSAIKDAIQKLIHQKGSEDMAGLISFNDDVVENCPFTRDKDLFLENLKALQPAGKSTVLFKAVYTGLEMLERQGIPPLRYLVVLSDGKDEGVGFTLDDAVSKAQKLRIPVYALGFAGKAETKYLDNMARLANMTNGDYRKVKGSSEVIDAYAVMAGSIFQQQALDMEAGFDGDGLPHHLEIRYTDPGGSVGKAAVDFTAPLFQAPVQENAAEDKTAVPHKVQFLQGFSNTALFGSLGAFILLLIAAFVILRRKRNRQAAALQKRMPAPAQPSKKANAAASESPKTPAALGKASAAESLYHLKIDGKEETIPLKPEPVTIGAYRDCAIVLSYDTVSGYHAEISGNGKEWVLKDLGSTNGTRLNGRYIKKPEPIKAGDSIRIGPVTLRVQT